ncbi:MAG: hypothetical protein Kow0089_23620 [Desulfobulbaceae bacterium]
MKKLLTIIGLVLAALVCVLPAAMAMDFASMSNQDLYELRGAIQNAPEKDRTAYQAEWEKRLAAMSDEEKKLFTEPEKKEGDGETLDPPVVPARGYEKEGTQGRIIFGGFPPQ